MDTGQNAKTVAVKTCVECVGGLLEYDRFCRWCGVQQPDSSRAFSLPATHQLDNFSYTGSIKVDQLCKRVSGPLINAVIEGMGPTTAVAGKGSIMRAAILALVSLPMWLMIILLSPLDAFAAARSLVRQV